MIEPVHWMRHAITATHMRIAGEEPNADHLGSESLLNALEHFLNRPDWRTVPLLEVADFASLMGPRGAHGCTCRSPHRPSLDW